MSQTHKRQLSNFGSENLEKVINTLSVGVRSQLTFTCSNSTIELLEKRCEIYSKLIIKTPKRRH